MAFEKEKVFEAQIVAICNMMRGCITDVIEPSSSFDEEDIQTALLHKLSNLEHFILIVSRKQMEDKRRMMKLLREKPGTAGQDYDTDVLAKQLEMLVIMDGRMLIVTDKSDISAELLPQTYTPLEAAEKIVAMKHYY